ncbi:L-lactate dehydrogenase [Haloplasma contractile]|uniref:L-lactate dehydrogenase n=1 Tax=Haloplasma contractile SSD-17B TaxID=1033810 RepID=U2EEC1_9MOLU|nr:L-lactate dehydrogenase [Haloplasma contractile]ERJ13041.1 L-lactate dehydrogenase 2 protein [Haloplasma contractile SSD-17B]
MNNRDLRKVVLVGAGFVGMSYAFALLNQGVVDELTIINRSKDKALGEAMDLNHGLSYAPKDMKIKAGDYNDCKDADLVVITAGASQKTGETRLQLVNKNAKIIRQIVDQIMESGFNGILLVASNPVDIMSYVAWKQSGLESNKVIGSGTTLDTARLQYELSKYLDISSKSINAYIIGEHGDTEFPVWSNAYIGVKPLLDVIKEDEAYQYKDLEKIYTDVRDAAYQIIEKKKATYLGIGMALMRITKAIVDNENSILTVSVNPNGEFSMNNLYIGLPVIINRNGVRDVVSLNLTPRDKALLRKSEFVLKETIQSLED